MEGVNHVAWESVSIMKHKSFPSNISRKEALLVFAEHSELWTNCSFYGMFPAILFCIILFYLVQDFSHFSLIKRFLREYPILVISHSVHFSLGISSFRHLLNDWLIDWLMNWLMLLLISGFSWLAETTPGHPVVGKLGPKNALPLASLHTLRWSSVPLLLSAI